MHVLLSHPMRAFEDTGSGGFSAGAQHAVAADGRRAARDGRPVYEAQPQLAELLCLEAAQFRCDGRTGAGARLRRSASGADAVSGLDRAVLAEQTMAVDRHLRRVAQRGPEAAADLSASTDRSDERLATGPCEVIGPLASAARASNLRRQSSVIGHPPSPDG